MTDRDWKSDYFKQLAAQEQETARWSEVDSLLRRTASRLALATEGLSEELDQRGEALRRALKNSDDVAALQNEFDALSELLSRSDGRGTERRYLAGTDALAELIGRIKWPRSLRKNAQHLRKQLAKTRYPADVVQYVDEVNSLIENVRVECVPPQGGDKPGSKLAALLSRFAVASSPLLPAVRRLLRAVRGKLGLAGPAAEAVDRQLAQVDSLGQAALAQLADELSGLLTQPALSQPSGEPSSGVPPRLNEMLTLLLSQLSLPQSQHQDLADLKNRLQVPLLPGEWPEVLEDIAELVGQMRESVESEKRDLEKFLTQVMLSLQELDVTLQGTVTQHNEAQREGVALSEAFASGVRDITDSMAKVRDVDQLKKVVQARLELIREHMDSFRDSESHRHREQDEQMRLLMNRLHELETETETLRQRVREQRQRALRDPLTGIFNRLAYDERIEQEFLRWKRFRQPLSLMVWDIDHFKKINDQYGHKVGDRVLMAVAQTLAAQIREADFVARYGGEEFVIIATGTAGSDALKLAEKLRDKTSAKKFRYQDQDIPVTLSCGIAEFREGMTPDDVFSVADATLYEAKQAGRNCCRLATDGTGKAPMASVV